eukprot:ANDGO_05428.mRNA.1 hypothetical protein
MSGMRCPVEIETLVRELFNEKSVDVFYLNGMIQKVQEEVDRNPALQSAVSGSPGEASIPEMVRQIFTDCLFDLTISKKTDAHAYRLFLLSAPLRYPNMVAANQSLEERVRELWKNLIDEDRSVYYELAKRHKAQTSLNPELQAESKRKRSEKAAARRQASEKQQQQHQQQHQQQPPLQGSMASKNLGASVASAGESADAARGKAGHGAETQKRSAAGDATEKKTPAKKKKRPVIQVEAPFSHLRIVADIHLLIGDRAMARPEDAFRFSFLAFADRLFTMTQFSEYIRLYANTFIMGDGNPNSPNAPCMFIPARHGMDPGATYKLTVAERMFDSRGAELLQDQLVGDHFRDMDHVALVGTIRKVVVSSATPNRTPRPALLFPAERVPSV